MQINKYACEIKCLTSNTLIKITVLERDRSKEYVLATFYFGKGNVQI